LARGVAAQFHSRHMCREARRVRLAARQNERNEAETNRQDEFQLEISCSIPHPGWRY